LQIGIESRGKGYGTELVKYLVTYLLKINQLRVRVHPVIGQQVFEALAEAWQNPNLLQEKKFEQKVFDSEDLKKWYRKRGFTIDDPDGQHLWYAKS
jgi:GNAT superfamily N-acetyltransferase